ncbi:MAG: MBL fold metallo-hydrolase [Bacteroidetes bacterium]|nr:MBL fold metallo-hydrolase [Bacteroidota bacterium]
MKRHASVIILCFFVLTSFAQPKTVRDESQFLKVTLLGTGTPQPIIERFGPSILVQAGNQSLLFDAGRGCLQRLNQIKLSYDKIDALFLTHLHSDHVVGLPDLWLTGWLLSRRAAPLKVFGPAGTNDMVTDLQKAFAFDINIRIKDDKAPENGSKLNAIEIHQGVIYEKGGVKVVAFEVDHGPVKPAFGYRIDYKGHSVVLSGDTRYSENLVRFAGGTDLLIHEVAIAPDTLHQSNPRYSILAHHTTPEQAAKVFNEVKPKLAAYSHIVRLYGLGEEDLLKRTKANYSGPFVIGQDLMSFVVADTIAVGRGITSKPQ